MRTPQSYVKITLKVLHSFSQVRSRLAQRSGLSVVRKAGLHSHPPSRSLPPTWSPKPLVHYKSVHFKHMNITEKEINAIWFKCQFPQEPDISDTNH